MIILFSLSFGSRYTMELGDVTPHNIKQLKRLNQVTFPVSYNDKFYKDVLELGELAKLGKCSLVFTSRMSSVPSSKELE